MKSSEFHRLVKNNGWVFLRSAGSHFIYIKHGRTYPVPYHGSKEMPMGIERKIRKEMQLK